MFNLCRERNKDKNNDNIEVKNEKRMLNQIAIKVNNYFMDAVFALKTNNNNFKNPQKPLITILRISEHPH